MIIDASNLILGRMASFAAKQARLGEKVDIVNCSNAVISGNKQRVFSDYLAKIKMGSSTRGPFFYRSPDRFVKRTIRGMLPYKRHQGSEAMKRIKCYTTVPESLKEKKSVDVKDLNVSSSSILKFVTVKEVCQRMGGK